MARLHPFFATVPAVLFFAPVVGAAPEQPRTLFGREVHDVPEMTPEEIEARRESFHEVLERQGLVLKDNQVLPKAVADGDKYFPPGISEAGEWDQPPHRSTIFLNFFGGPLSFGNNASQGESPCVMGKVDYPAYKGSEQTALAIIQIFQDAAAPFGLRIAYEDPPPKHLPYSQVMMGGHSSTIGLGNGVLGVSCNLDCGDAWLRDTTFAFTEESNNVGVLGTTALQEAAHSFGLDHIAGQNNIMYPFATLGKKVWADTCTPYDDSTGGIGCTVVHKKFCPADADNPDGRQNDVAELTAYFGVNTPDVEPPTVKMLSPVDGQQYTKGENVHIEVEVNDDHLGFGWHLMVPELKQEQPVYNGQTVWDFPAPGKGVYTIQVEALDHDHNTGIAQAKIYVDIVPGEETGSTGDTDDTGATPTTGDVESSGGSGDSSGGGSEASAGETDGLSDSQTAGLDTGDVKNDDGCSCRDAAPAPGPTWLLALGGALALRRRRRA